MAAELKGVVRGLYDLGAYVEKRFRADGALNMASSLSYTSLLSLVPLLAIALAMLAAFPVFDDVRERLEASLFHYLVPEVGEQVQGYVTGFVANAGKLTAAGIVGLAVSSVMVLVTIESSLNVIFRVATPRSPMSKVLVYWTALTLGPLLLGASFSMSAHLSMSANLYAAGDWVEREGLSSMRQMFAQVSPTLLLVVAFALLYVAVPNRRVKTGDALIGAVAAGLAFTGLRWGFAVYVANSRAYGSIYGAVAMVPIFLFWMYLSWTVVLFGAELAAALPEWRLARHDLGGPLPARRRLVMALNILAALLDDARRNGRGCGRQDLLDAVGEAEHPFLTVLDRLQTEGYVVPTADNRWVLGRDLEGVTLADVVHGLDLGLHLSEAEAETYAAPWMARISDCLIEAARAETAALNLPLRPVLDEAGEHS
jgi:membrane protein